MSADGQPLPLFPLHTVLFPAGRLGLKVFEARYFDLVSQCLRTQQPFGVVCLTAGHEAGDNPAAAKFEAVGTLTRIDQADAQQPGILKLACTGTQRFRLTGPPTQGVNGQWRAPFEALPVDVPVAPPAHLRGAATALNRAAALLQEQGLDVIAQPWSWDDAGWVANRWGELLPLELPVRQQLLELNDPLQRLSRVAELMRYAGFPAGAEWEQEDPGPATHLH